MVCSLYRKSLNTYGSKYSLRVPSEESALSIFSDHLDKHLHYNLDTFLQWLETIFLVEIDLDVGFETINLKFPISSGDR